MFYCDNRLKDENKECDCNDLNKMLACGHRNTRCDFCLLLSVFLLSSPHEMCQGPVNQRAMNVNVNID